jgi:hypothetical protein
MTGLPKWTAERTEALVKFVGDDTPVCQETVAEAAEFLETSPRSISSKLRKMDIEVELASARAKRAYNQNQEETLRALVEDNSDVYTYAEISALFEDGHFSPKSIQGKILSMELTQHVKPAPKPVVVRTYTDEEQETFITMVKAKASVEELAEALGKNANSIRGKGLSLLKLGFIEAIPKQAITKSASRVDPLAALGDLADLTVEAIADEIEKTVRGVRVMLTRRGLNCANYKGADRKAKAVAATVAAAAAK